MAGFYLIILKGYLSYSKCLLTAPLAVNLRIEGARATDEAAAAAATRILQKNVEK